MKGDLLVFLIGEQKPIVIEYDSKHDYDMIFDMLSKDVIRLDGLIFFKHAIRKIIDKPAKKQ